MPMNRPFFTTSADRIQRLQENYDDGLARESLPTETREKLDMRCLVVTPAKLRFLHQNALEGYDRRTKNEKVQEFNKTYLA